MLSLLPLSLLNFLRKVVQIESRLGSFYIVCELIRWPGVFSNDPAVLHKVDFDLQIIDQDAVFVVAIEPVGLFDQIVSDRANSLEKDCSNGRTLKTVPPNRSQFWSKISRRNSKLLIAVLPIIFLIIGKFVQSNLGPNTLARVRPRELIWQSTSCHSRQPQSIIPSN